jgi:hypothetical protein
VVPVDDIEREGERLHARKELATHDRMPADLGEFLGGEAGGLEEHGVSGRDLPDVVE